MLIRVLLALTLAPALLAQQVALPVVTTEALQAHYGAVGADLSGADTSQLDAERLARRQALLRELEAYRLRADFGRNPHEHRRNLFRDAEGRLCAVGNLMHVTGHDALIERIVAGHNEAFVLELADVPGVADWLAQSGFTAAEAARIQGPGIGFALPLGQIAGGVAASEGGTTGGAAVRGATTGSSSAAAPATTGAGRPERGRTAVRDEDHAVTGGMPVEPWWTWWELNKSSFLPLHRLTSQAPGQQRYAVDDDVRARLLVDLEPRLVAQLDDRDATVRAAAALTYGRLYGAGAVPALLPLLADNVVSVREAALLALGATGSMRGAHELLGVARDGRFEGSTISADARPLALVALGIARRRGAAEPVDDFVAELTRSTSRDAAESQRVREAALLALELARSPLAVAGADEILTGGTEDPLLECRALEALGSSMDPAHVPALLRQAGSRNLERRRASAVALAAFDDPLLAAALATAVEVEAEPLARGFLLLALGGQDSATARDFLIRMQREGSFEAQPWAALALGLRARRDGDELARSALRTRLPEAGEAQGAWVLACGLARDPQAIAALAELLADAANPRVRMFAALSLAMIGGNDATHALRARLGVETSPLARVGIAQALGLLGREKDADVLLHELRTLSSPPMAAQVATAVGFHGTEAAAAGLATLLAEAQLPPLTRAAGLDAMALLLDRGEPLLLAQVGCDRNFMALPEWLLDVLPTSTL